MAEPGEVTRILQAAGEGDREAAHRLAPIVYDGLREMARGMLARNRGSTIEPTALVHEAWVRLVGGTPHFENRAHFFGAAAEAMRRLLVDFARERKAQKRGGGKKPVTLQDLGVAVVREDFDLLELDAALEELQAEDEQLAEVVKLRFFAGMTIQETADMLSVSPTTVKRRWLFARAWLFDRIAG